MKSSLSTGFALMILHDYHFCLFQYMFSLSYCYHHFVLLLTIVVRVIMIFLFIAIDFNHMSDISVFLENPVEKKIFTDTTWKSLLPYGTSKYICTYQHRRYNLMRGG
jgi:hypothetical protein